MSERRQLRLVPLYADVTFGKRASGRGSRGNQRACKSRIKGHTTPHAQLNETMNGGSHVRTRAGATTSSPFSNISNAAPATKSSTHMSKVLHMHSDAHKVDNFIVQP